MSDRRGTDYTKELRLITRVEELVREEAPETVGHALDAMTGTGSGVADKLLDIHGERLELMGKYNVDHLVLTVSMRSSVIFHR